MYCRKCGAQLDDDSAFCSVCGTSCAEERELETGESALPQENSPSQPQKSAQPVGGDVPRHTGRNPYYEAEFQKIQAGEATKFNWAAFLLGPFHQLYHGSVKLFQKTFLPYLIAVFAVTLGGQIAALFTAASLSVTGLAVTGLLSLLSMGVSVWGLVLAILNGKNYNKKLYEQVQGNAEAIPARKKPALLLFVGYVGVILVVSVLISVIGGKMVANAWMSGLEESGDVYDVETLSESADDADTASSDWNIESSSVSQNAASSAVSNGDEQQTANSENLLDLSSLPELDSQQMTLFSQCFWADSQTGNGFDGFSLLGDDSMTLGELFGTVFDSYTWDDSYMIEQGTEATVYDAVCTLDGAQLRLRFSQLYAMIQPISEATVYQADGTMYSLSRHDIAGLMARLCDRYHELTGTQPTSLVKEMQGTWVSSDGETELVIDGTTYGGSPYQIHQLTSLISRIGEGSGDIPVEVTRSDGTIDERFLELSGDFLSVYEAEPSGPSIEKGEILGFYSRVG